MKKLSDIEIIESVLNGNQGDFALLVGRYKDKAFSLLKRLLKNEMDAEDALQDSFLKAFNGLSSFRKDSKFSTWFYRITYNTGLTIVACKKRKIEQQMSSIDEHFDLGAYDNEIYSTTTNVREYILKMVDKLPIRNALVINLFYIDDMSLKEISEVMDISLVNAKVLWYCQFDCVKLFSANFVRKGRFVGTFPMGFFLQ